MTEENGDASRRLQHSIRQIRLRLQVRLHAHQLQHSSVDAGNSVQENTFRHEFEKAASTRNRLRAAIFRPGHPGQGRLLLLHGPISRIFLEIAYQITTFYENENAGRTSPTPMLSVRPRGYR